MIYARINCIPVKPLTHNSKSMLVKIYTFAYRIYTLAAVKTSMLPSLSRNFYNIPIIQKQTILSIITTTILQPFVRDYPDELVPEG